jgi:hypothetical protein
LTKFTEFKEIFNLGELQKIVKIESMESCSSSCEKRIDFIVNMSPSEISFPSYYRQDIMKRMGFNTELNFLLENEMLKNLDTNWVDWDNGSKISSELGHIAEKCLELYQPYPALKMIVDGSMESIPSSLKFQSYIENTAKKVAEELFANRPYISIHWRFEYQKKGESKCRKKNLPTKGSGDICFVMFLKKERMTKKDYLNFGDCRNCEKYLQYVHIDDVGEILRTIQKNSGGHEIYLASDAGKNVLREVRKHAKFKMISDSELGRSLLESENMERVSVIEQALCVRGKVFFGTSYSTWTTTVWMLRPLSNQFSKRIDGFLDVFPKPKTPKIDGFFSLR